MGAPLWQGRFASPPADELLAFTASLPFDRRLGPDDVVGSRAHVRMLARVGYQNGRTWADLPQLTVQVRATEQGKPAVPVKCRAENVNRRLALLSLAGKRHNAFAYFVDDCADRQVLDVNRRRRFVSFQRRAE
jgi:hypothetical protein